jgi:hypothetical protein
MFYRRGAEVHSVRAETPVKTPHLEVTMFEFNYGESLKYGLSNVDKS